MDPVTSTPLITPTFLGVAIEAAEDVGKVAAVGAGEVLGGHEVDERDE